MERATGSARRQRDWTFFRRGGICIHDLCGGVGGAQTGTDVADWPRESVDARTSLAGIAFAAADFISWGISFWRRADGGADVAADCYGGQRSLWRGAAELDSQENDGGTSAGNNLRRDWTRAGIAGGRGGSQRGGTVRKVFVEKRRFRDA